MESVFYSFKKNETVRIRDGYRDNDTDTDLSRWTGTVLYAETGGTVLVRWTQETLDKMPKDYIEYMEESELGREEYELYETDLLPIGNLPDDGVAKPSFTQSEVASEEHSFPKSNEITAVPERFRVITHFIIYVCLFIPYSYYWGYVSYYAVLQILEGDFEFVISWMGFLGFAMVNIFMLILTAGLISRINMIRKHKKLRDSGMRAFVEIIRAKHRPGRLAAQYAEFEFRGKFVRQQLTHLSLSKLQKGDRIEITYLPDMPEILTIVR
jgi:hypothetical protein